VLSSLVAEEGAGGEAPVIARRVAELRLTGQNTTLSIDLVPGTDLRERFVAAYRTMYGHAPPDRVVEIESVRVIARGPGRGLDAVGAEARQRLDTSDRTATVPSGENGPVRIVR